MENNIIHIFYIKQTEKLADEIFQQFLLQLPDQFQQDINAYKHWQSAQSSLLGKILLQYGFQKLNFNYSLHNIQIADKDRPFINNKIDFNISHSGEYIIVAISDFSKVGMDIEKHRTLKQDIAARYFNKHECKIIDASENPEQTFFNLWSIKESAIKCDGRGVEVLSKTHVVFSKQDQLLYADKIKCDAAIFHYQQIAIEANYSCCISSNEDFRINLTQLNLSDLINA